MFLKFHFQYLTLITEQKQSQVGEHTSWTTQLHIPETVQNCRKVGKTAAGCCGNQVRCKLLNDTHLREAFKSSIFLYVSIEHENRHVMYTVFLFQDMLFRTYIIDSMEAFHRSSTTTGAKFSCPLFFFPNFQLDPN